MNRFTICLAIFFTLVAMSCMNGESTIAPSLDTTTTPASVKSPGSKSNILLWGWYDVAYDLDSGEFIVSQNRNASFTTNIVGFLNTDPTALNLTINSTDLTPDWFEIDLDVHITHPFPGLPKFDGYDVRGIFMGDGSGLMNYGEGFQYPVNSTDQMMVGSSENPGSGPDGYTRWFNLTEFSEGGQYLFSYTDGSFASDGFNGSATLCPYKYFANNLGINDDLWSWLSVNSDLHGVFSSGATNSRNYTLRFPIPSPGIRFGYAITANWEGTQPENYPSNTPEAVACSVVDSSDLWFEDPTDFGGDLKLDVSLFDWDTVPSTIYVESSVLSGVYEFDPGSNPPTYLDSYTSTWHVEIPADEVKSMDNNEVWIIAEYAFYDYSNPFGTSNLAVDKPLAAFFRYDLTVLEKTENSNPVCDLQLLTEMPVEDLSPVAVSFDASGSWDPDGDDLTYEWDFDGDGFYSESTDDDYIGDVAAPVHGYFENYDGVASVRITDGNGGESICGVDVSVTAIPSKNLPLRDVEPEDIAIDPSDGHILILYDDLEIWRRNAGDFYQSPSHLVTTHESYPGMSRIDINSDGWFLNAGYVPALQRPMGQFRDSAGGNPQFWNFEWGPAGFVSDQYRFIDVIAFGDAGTHAKDIGPFTGAPFQSAHEVRFLNLTDTGNFHSWTRYSNNHTGDDHTGLDVLHYDWVKGAESDLLGDYIWFVENGEFVTTRWSLSAPSPNSNGTWEFDNIYFGTGIQSDSDDCWNDARDLTRDHLNRYFVLDSLSTGEPRIKVWDFDGTSTEFLGSFGDSTSIIGDPLRFEGGDFDGKIFVIHGDASSGWYLSIFQPLEIP